MPAGEVLCRISPAAGPVPSASSSGATHESPRSVDLAPARASGPRPPLAFDQGWDRPRRAQRGCVCSLAVGMEARFYFGVISPYSWFAAERIGDLLPEARWRPVFAGGLFRSVHRGSWGTTPQRAARI